MDIKIAVLHNGRPLHVLDLAQEGEGFWSEFLQEMENAGHGAETICRTIAERLKYTVQPVLTQPPGAAIGVNALHEAIDKFFAENMPLRDDIVVMQERLYADVRDMMHTELGRVTQSAATVDAANDDGVKREEPATA